MEDVEGILQRMKLSATGRKGIQVGSGSREKERRMEEQTIGK